MFDQSRGHRVGSNGSVCSFLGRFSRHRTARNGRPFETPRYGLRSGRGCLTNKPLHRDRVADGDVCSSDSLSNRSCLALASRIGSALTAADPGGFEQEPYSPFCLIDPVLDQACGCHISQLVRKTVDLAHPGPRAVYCRRVALQACPRASRHPRHCP
jgi:hypothetical protein